MSKLRAAQSNSYLIIGSILILLSSAFIVSFTIQFSSDIDPEGMEFTTWINEKRALVTDMDIDQISLNTNGMVEKTPATRMSYTGGGSLLWKSEVIPGSQEYVSTPLLEDLDGDGDLEVIAFTSADGVMAFTDDGANYWDAPFTDAVIDYLGQTSGTSGLDFDPPHIFPSPKSFDPNDGLGPRILVPAKDGMHCLNRDGERIWTGGSSVGHYFSTPAITDIEGVFAGDMSDWELVIASDDESRRGWIEVLDLNGTLLTREEAPSGGEGSLIGCAVVTEDLDGSYWDGPWKAETITDEEVNLEILTGNHDRGLRIWKKVWTNSQGGPQLKEMTTGWLAGHQTYATHAVGNVTGGPEMELFVGSAEGYARCWNGWGGKVYVYTPEGKKLWDYATGSADASVFSSPCLTDLQMAKFDPDETHLDYELIFGADTGFIYVMNTELHSLLWSFDTKARVLSSPSVCDIYNDNQLEIIVGSDSGKVFCFDGDPSDGIDEGISYPGDSYRQDVLWVYDAGNPIGISSPVIADIDLDGVLEVVIGDTKGVIHCISAGGSCIKGRQDWPSFHQNNNNTGFYNPDHTSYIDLHPTIQENGERSNTSVILKPGGSYTFDLTLKNKGASEPPLKDIIYIGVDEKTLPKGWKIHIDTPPLEGNDDPDHLKMAEDESRRIPVTVWPALECTEPVIAQIVIKANHSIDHWIRDELLLQVNLQVLADVEAYYEHQVDDDPFSNMKGRKWEAIAQSGQFDVDVRIFNRGTVNDTMQLKLTNPPMDVGWDWYFLGTDVRVLDVPLIAPQLVGMYPGKSQQTLTVRINCPHDAIADQDMRISLIAISLAADVLFEINVSSYDEFHVVVSEQNGLWLDIVGTIGETPPGEEEEISVRITNLGNREAVVVLLEHDPMPDHWHVELTNEPVIVFRGQTRTISCFVQPPYGSLAGSSALLTVRGTIKDQPHICSKASIVVKVEQVHEHDVEPYGIELREGFPGDDVDFEFRLSNSGNGDECFSFKPIPIEGWSFGVYDPKDRELDRITLNAYSDDQLRLLVCIPEDALVGIFKIFIQIQAENGKETLMFEVKVLQISGFEIRSMDGDDSISIEAQINKESRSRCAVTNTGNGIDEAEILIGGHGSYGSIIELPEGTRAGLFSISQNVDQKGDVIYWNTSSTLDLTQFSPNKLFIPEIQLLGGPLSGNEPITYFKIRLPPGGSVYLEIWFKQGPGDEGGPVDTSSMIIGVIREGVREILPFYIEFLYPDLYFHSGIEIAGSSSEDGHNAKEGDRLTFIVKIANKGEANAEDVIVQLYVDDKPVANVTLPYVPLANPGSKMAILTWEAQEGKHLVRIVLDPYGSIFEMDDLEMVVDPGDNEISTKVDVEGDGLPLSSGTIVVLITIIMVILVLVTFVGSYFGLRKKKDI